MQRMMAAGQTFEVAQAANLREALLEQDIHLYSNGAQILNCHGHGMCGTCLVQVEGAVSAPTQLETMRMALPPNYGHKERRLACQTKVLGDVRVTKYDGHFGEGETVRWTPEEDLAETSKITAS
jgi:ferredoxin